jgi:fimbrial chaperone protein
MAVAIRPNRRSTLKTLPLIITAFFALAAAPAFAGHLEVSPVGFVLPPSQKVDKLTLTNHNEIPTQMQIQAFVWTQIDGKNVETPTTAIRFSPSIVEVPAKGQQIVRVIRMSPPVPGEAQYRIKVSELPPKEIPGVRKAGAVLLLTYNLPLFYRPTGAQASLAMRWEGKELVVKNSGNSTGKLSAIGPASAAAWVPGLVGYILPGSEMRFAMPATAPSVNITVNGVASTISVR